ncbi:cytochrome c biogenesis CcdA family protein [Pseudomonas sp. CGJS7]|uniref:cytochrome c biogenesis CcdA family protein n=1 Tax=Pseudomonas sp. CGJS7 TaxID=3109348 RepID=UPI00300AD5DF
MSVTVATLGLSGLAGLLTALSPCVLPVLPMVASSATGRSRWGLVTLAAGLALSFTIIGVVVTSSGSLLGLDERTLRKGAGALMLVFGTILLSQTLQHAMERVVSRFGDVGGRAALRIRSDHPAAQFAVGSLMGVAWTPCVGPTLGAAIALAANGKDLGEVSLVMLVFSLAAALPLVALGLASRSWFLRNHDRAARFAQIGRRAMGVGLLAIGLLVLTGMDKQLESLLLQLTPAWLVELTTRY